MTSIDDKKLFETYYQSSFDFNTADLNGDDIYEIKMLVKEKRVTYGSAPIGENIFEFITSHCRDIKFEKISFRKLIDIEFKTYSSFPIFSFSCFKYL